MMKRRSCCECHVRCSSGHSPGSSSTMTSPAGGGDSAGRGTSWSDPELPDLAGPAPVLGSSGYCRPVMTDSRRAYRVSMAGVSCLSRSISLALMFAVMSHDRRCIAVTAASIDAYLYPSAAHPPTLV